ncbi:hypothetical protein [Methanocalculus sp.]|uniref:hypothetical protein n=1 Tax=Methanocalculus sp. TaxID=2004547 RepID=UPI0025E83565|nr:hypothetical protein [Methanocalculus sp.]
MTDSKLKDVVLSFGQHMKLFSGLLNIINPFYRMWQRQQEVRHGERGTFHPGADQIMRRPFHRGIAVLRSI